MSRYLTVCAAACLSALLLIGGTVMCARTELSDNGAQTRSAEAGTAGRHAADARSDGDAQSGSRRTDTAVVTMEDLDFVPSRITIEQGQTVLWKNTSPLVHTVTAVRELARNPAHVALPPGAEPFNSGTLQPGDQFAHTFTIAGEYRYFCIPHEAAGMIGAVTVRETGEE